MAVRQRHHHLQHRKATCLSESFGMKMLKIGCMICYDMIIEMEDILRFYRATFTFETFKKRYFKNFINLKNVIETNSKISQKCNNCSVTEE